MRRPETAPGEREANSGCKLKNGMQLLDTPGRLGPESKTRKPVWIWRSADPSRMRSWICRRWVWNSSACWLRTIRSSFRKDTNWMRIAETPLENMENMAVKRGCILPGKRIDYERIARLVLDEFRGGKIGRITLERPQR